MTNLLLFPPFPTDDLADESPAGAALPDESERASALDTTASWIVEAPAGSGKTGLLMQRFLKLLASETVTDPEEVLAITFTRKATAELRDRVLEQLEAAHANTPLAAEASAFDRATRDYAEKVLARDAKLHWDLLQNTAELRIRTIDAVCAEMARSLPLLSGSGVSGAPLEDARPLYRLAARRTIMHLGGADPVLHDALHTVLLHRDGNLADCEALLANMLGQREQWAELVPLDRASLSDEALEIEVRPRLEETLRNVICTGLSRAARAVSANALHALAQLAERMSSSPGHPAESPIATCAGRASAPGADAEHLDHWVALAHLLLTQEGSWRKSFAANHLRFPASKAEQAEIKAIIDSLDSNEARETLQAVRALPPGRYPEDQWRVAKALFRLLLHALAELKILFAERGECDFSELSLAAREALRSEGGVADLASVGGRTLRHLLVDEMQDTSSAQYELLELLTQSWDGHSQTLFLVGDPKQSIYIFRQARVERFLRTIQQQRLGDLTLRALRLSANFRSQENLVEQFNHDFSRIFPTPQELAANRNTDDVPFVSAHAVRQPGGSSGVEWHAGVLASKDPRSKRDPKRDRAIAEAREIRRIVEDWRLKPLPAHRTEPWRIAVLARARNHLAPVLKEFQSTVNGAPVPFRAVDIEQLGERQEVLDAVALTRALLHPADRLAWLAVLRAPWCGLGVADLLALTGEGAVVSAETSRAITIPSLIASRSSQLSSTGQALLNRVWPTLQAAQRQVGRTNLPDLIERTWLSLGGDVILRAEERANVQRYLELVRDVLQPGERLELRVLREGLKNLYAESTSESEAVDMMTIHKAKGLEWDVVIIPALERPGQISRYELLNWLELDAAQGDNPSVLLAPIHQTGERVSTLSAWIRNTKENREEAERKRLLYVACTRAKEELHLFAACERKKGGELTAARGTLLRSFWPAAEQHFARFTQTYLGETWREPEPEEDSAGTTEQEETFALAAAAEAEPASAREKSPAVLQRLPLSYDTARRFRLAAADGIPAPPALVTQTSSAFDRPEGSYAIRAFGNTVHRFLELVAKRLEAGIDANELLRELPSWQPRLVASLRSEGLPPAVCVREAARGLQTLTASLTDPVGRWVLLPRANAASESTLTLAAGDHTTTMRVDRTFNAGSTPLSTGHDTRWIIDFKTTEQGSRTPARFEEEERAKYGPQLASYAMLLRASQSTDRSIMLGLYYPAVPALIHWPA